MELRQETRGRPFLSQRISFDSLEARRVSEGDERSRMLEADRESGGVLSSTPSLPVGPYGKDHPSEYGQASLSTVLALRHFTRTHDTLTSEKTRRFTNRRGAGYCGEEERAQRTVEGRRLLLEYETDTVD